MAQNSSNQGNLAEISNNGSSANNAAPSSEKKEAVMDIKKYLQKAKLGKSISGLLEVVFKGTLAKESEWPKKVEEATKRQVK
jgi:hypothetical protein